MNQEQKEIQKQIKELSKTIHNNNKRRRIQKQVLKNLIKEIG